MKREKIIVILFYMLILLIWQAVFSLGLVPHYVFPSPGMVAQRLIQLVGDGIMWPSIKMTLTRMLYGFGISICIGLGFGVAMGVYPLVNKCLRSLFLGLQSLPSVAWVPISLLVFGLRDAGIYFVIIMSSMASVAISVADGIANIPPIFIRAARTLGTPPSSIWYRVMIPAALPGMVTGIKLGWTMGWHGAVSAELIKSTVGLGFLLHMGRELNDVAQVIGIMLVTIMIGMLLDRFVFGKIEINIRRRWGLVHGH